jgi:hypothetical protein
MGSNEYNLISPILSTTSTLLSSSRSPLGATAAQGFEDVPVCFLGRLELWIDPG